MKHPGVPRYAPFYDLFKLGVSVILTILLILLLLRERQHEPGPAGAIPATTTREQAGRPVASVTPDVLFPTPTSILALTATPLLAGSPDSPRPTATPGLTPLPTEIISTSDPKECPASPTRIQVGDRVRVLSWLNFRTGPGRQWPIIQTNILGTVMEVVGGPVCTARGTAIGSKAYLWWKVRMADGREGWSAEAPLIDPDYFLEPVR